MEVMSVEKIDYLREEINEIDESLVKLFKKRMDIVSKVAEYKIKNSMIVLDKTREEEIINKHLDGVEDKVLKGNLKEFLEDLMSISRKTQKDIISKASKVDKTEKEDSSYKIGFQGVEASFSHQALIEYFGPERQTSCFPSFKDVFDALDRGDIGYGILPVENSSTGVITEVYDLLRKYGFYIVGEKCIKVDHNLLGIKGAKLSDINEVYSHEQGFLQSKEFFSKHKDWSLIPYLNTAKSALYISRENLKNKACVASKKAAETYGLDILEENINYNRNNYTKFVIIGRNIELNEECDKITIVTTLAHKVGALYNILKHFSENNCNMMKIESRPIVDKSWEYFFHIDFQGNLLHENIKTVLKGIEEESLYFKFLGNYKGEVI
jgi:monofunctional chorismate mutase, gram positive-type, clade 2